MLTNLAVHAFVYDGCSKQNDNQAKDQRQYVEVTKHAFPCQNNFFLFNL